MINSFFLQFNDQQLIEYYKLFSITLNSQQKKLNNNKRNNILQTPKVSQHHKKETQKTRYCNNIINYINKINRGK